MQATISILVKGKVQGVFYRQSTQEKATALGVTGTVKNLRDGSVKIIATGTKEQLATLVAWCRIGPPKASVTSLETNDETLQQFANFKILR